MTILRTAALASAGPAPCLALCACNTTGSQNIPTTAAQAETSNANNLNANGSAQPGGAGPSPHGGESAPGTSGTVSNTPNPGPH